MSTVTPEPENATFKTVFLINLIVYNPVKPTTKKKKSEKKVNKLKEANLVIALTAEDYINFPHAVRATHGKTEYQFDSRRAPEGTVGNVDLSLSRARCHE